MLKSFNFAGRVVVMCISNGGSKSAGQGTGMKFYESRNL